MQGSTNNVFKHYGCDLSHVYLNIGDVEGLNIEDLKTQRDWRRMR